MKINHPELEIVAACSNPAQLLPSYRGEIRMGDLRDLNYQDRLLAGIDIVCHTDAEFIGDDEIAERAYLEPTLELINRVLEWRIRRFV
ncbi:MAG: hypothetical protein EP315_02740, partial [Gammaproteobacteria bacterium]